jgi:chromosome partitioning protein
MAGARTKAVFSGMALGKEEAMGGLPKVIATVNFKGGVGKTTATWLLARVASEEDPVLVIDADAQMSLTTAVELSEETGRFPEDFERWFRAHQEARRTLFDAIDQFTRGGGYFDFPIDGRVAFRVHERLWLIPATSDLYWLTLEVFDRDQMQGFAHALVLKFARAGAGFRYVFFDCPPSFTVLSYSILTNCDLILVPVNPDVFADRGLNILLEGLELQLQPHPFPKVAVFMNRARLYRGGFTRETRYYWEQVGAICRKWLEKGIPIRPLRTFLPERADVRKSIPRGGRVPEDLRQELRKLWQEIREFLGG